MSDEDGFQKGEMIYKALIGLRVGRLNLAASNRMVLPRSLCSNGLRTLFPLFSFQDTSNPSTETIDAKPPYLPSPFNSVLFVSFSFVRITF